MENIFRVSWFFLRTFCVFYCFTGYNLASLVFVVIPSEARPKADPVDRVTRSGIRTTKVKKKF